MAGIAVIFNFLWKEFSLLRIKNTVITKRILRNGDERTTLRYKYNQNSSFCSWQKQTSFLALELITINVSKCWHIIKLGDRYEQEKMSIFSISQFILQACDRYANPAGPRCSESTVGYMRNVATKCLCHQVCSFTH